MKHTFLLFSVILSISLFLAGCGAAQEPTSQFEAVACPEEVEATECGYVSVPADHTEPGGDPFRLFVSIVRGSEAKATEPIFFLTGGPGELSAPFPGLLGAKQRYGDRDFVTFDQRGVGFSEPALNCEAYDAFLTEPATTSDEALAQQQLEILEGCGETLGEQHDLSLFTTTRSAADVDVIRQALGYETVDLVGVSYGTRLAQEVMRANPESLRAVVLDSVVPPQVNRPVDTVASTDAALERFFTACAEDDVCNASFPNLEDTYVQVYDQLEQTPLSYTFQGESAELDSDTLQAAIFQSLYSPSAIAQLATIIGALGTGDVTPFENSDVLLAINTLAGGAVTWPLFFATECRGEVAFSDVDDLRAAYETYPRWENSMGTIVGISSPKIFELCESWGLTEPSAAENDPISSDVPTLLLAGYLDPVTPPENLALATEGLSRATTVTFPDQAHGASLLSTCAASVVQTFLSDPSSEPDSGCAEGAEPVLMPDEEQ